MKVIQYSDLDIVTMMRNGGMDLERAFKHLMDSERQKQTLRRVLMNLGASHEDYEELLNDTLIALHTGIVKGRFKEQYSITAYMVGIAKKQWYKRRMKKRPETTPYPELVDDGQPSIEVQIIAHERRELLAEVVGLLDENCRKILIKAFLEELKNTELIKIMNYKNEAVVRKKKSQCLKRLIELLKEHPELSKKIGS